MNYFAVIYVAVLVYMLAFGLYYLRQFKRTYPHLQPDEINIRIFVVVALLPFVNLLGLLIFIVLQIQDLRRPKWE